MVDVSAEPDREMSIWADHREFTLDEIHDEMRYRIRGFTQMNEDVPTLRARIDVHEPEGVLTWRVNVKAWKEDGRVDDITWVRLYDHLYEGLAWDHDFEVDDE